MKKLLLLAAILALGTASLAVSEGISVNLGLVEPDTMYTPFTVRTNNYGGEINYMHDITTNDNAVDRERAANIFRDKGEGWEDIAATHVLLKVLEPIIIESEIDFLYTEAVMGDKLEIGDIGFRVKGEGPAEVKFDFIGPLFAELLGTNSKATVKGHNGFYPMKTVNVGAGAIGAARNVFLFGGQKEIEVDLYLDLTTISAGPKLGVIIARAEYQ